MAGDGVQFTFGVAAGLGGLFGELSGFVGQAVGQSCEPLWVEGAEVRAGGGGSAAEGPDDGADADGEAEAEQRIVAHLAGEAVACFFEAAGHGGCFHWVGCVGWGRGEFYLRESRPMNKPVRAAKPTALSGC